MRKIAESAGIVVLLLAVAFGSVFAAFVAWPYGAIGAALVFAAIGWLTGRWWTALVVPAVVGVWAGFTYVADPSGWDDGYEMTTAAWFAVFGIGALAAGAAVAIGVSARRARDHVREEPPGGGAVSA